MNNDQVKELNQLPTEELEEIVHRGENLHIPTSRASQAQRILESRRHAELIAVKQETEGKEETIKPTDLTIFYSWQSDLPNKTNRNLIEEALELAVKNLRQDSSIKITARVDKDTAGVPGSPNIATTILDKIDRAFLIVSDVSIINSGEKNRHTPNPNVVYELGYAVKSLGMSNVVMVQNVAYGGPEKLPFDLRLHRILTYEFDGDGGTAEVRRDLSTKLERAIKLALENRPASDSIPNINMEIQNVLAEKLPAIKLETLLKVNVDDLLSKLKQANLYSYNNPLSPEEFKTRKDKVEKILRELIGVYFYIGRWADKPYVGTIIRQFERLAHVPLPDGSYNQVWENLAHYPGLLLMYALGLGAIYNKNITILEALLKVKTHNHFTGDDDPIWEKTSVFGVFRYYKDVFKEEKRYFPGSDELFDLLKPYFEDLTAEKYEDIFDSFEYLLSLKQGEKKKDVSEERFWVPTGSYMWRTQRRRIWEVFQKEFDEDKEAWFYFPCFSLDKHNLQRSILVTNKFIVKHSGMYW